MPAFARILLASLLAMASSSCVAPAGDASRCEAAAGRLRACTGAVPDGFVEACLADPSEDSRAAIDAIARCDGVDDPSLTTKADGRAIAKYPFLAACTPAVLAAAVVNRARNPDLEPLPVEAREALRPYFGGLVDEVRVAFGAQMINRWTIFGREYELFMPVAAQTLGRNIYVDGPYSPDVWTHALLAHELVHSLQAKERGGLTAFAWNYCRAFWASRFDYGSNEMEVEAFGLEDEIRRCLEGGWCDVETVEVGRPENADCVPGAALDDGTDAPEATIHVAAPRHLEHVTLYAATVDDPTHTRMRVMVGDSPLDPSLWCHSPSAGVVEISRAAVTEAAAATLSVRSWTPPSAGVAYGLGDLPIVDHEPLASTARVPFDAAPEGAISIEVAIEHDDVSDLVVEIETPHGDRHTLHERSGARGDPLDRVFELEDETARSAPHGRWLLRVVDHVGGGQGRLLRWAVRW